MTEVKVPRLIVALKKITYPNGECLTRSLIHFDMDSYSYNPESNVFNKLLPEIDSEYELLLKKASEGNIVQALDQFFTNTSQYAVVGEGLTETLALDLKINTKDLEEALLNTRWFNTSVQYLKSGNKKRKDNPVEYAESVRQFVDIFTLEKALTLLRANHIELKRSTLTALSRVASETPYIKSLIQDQKLKLTIAFELPRVEGKEREKIADQLISFETYAEQKDFLKKIKECQ